MNYEVFGEGKQSPIHLARCAGELVVMYLCEVKTNILTALADAEDVWGADDE